MKGEMPLAIHEVTVFWLMPGGLSVIPPDFPF